MHSEQDTSNYIESTYTTLGCPYGVCVMGKYIRYTYVSMLRRQSLLVPDSRRVAKGLAQSICA